MRILFLSHYFSPEGNAPATRVHALARHWVKKAHGVAVITCAPNVPGGRVYEGYRNTFRAQTENIDGINVIRVWTYIAANKGTVRRIFNYLSYMVSAFLIGLRQPRPDIIVATSPQFFCGWAGIWLARFRRIPLVLEIRDLWPESIVAVGAGLPGPVIRYLEWLERRMYRAADHIVTVGEGYGQRLVEKGVPPGTISVVMNGVDPELFSPRSDDGALREKYGLNGRFVCSYIGTIGMACGLDVVLRAARLLKDRKKGDRTVFLLVGDGAYREELEAAAREDELDNVVFTGRVDKAKVPDVLASSNACLVHLRKTDLFTSVMPSKIFEAAGMARPIINGVAGFAAGFITDAGAGLNIEPDNEQELIAALERLQTDPELCRQLGESGLKYVREGYTREELAQTYLEILQTKASGQI